MFKTVQPDTRLIGGYQWEAIKVSPHTHAGVPVRRLRVFYVGIRKPTRRRRRLAA